ncbi:MAG: serine/threonine-protein kinase [Planctomycetota bacterium]
MSSSDDLEPPAADDRSSDELTEAQRFFLARMVELEAANRPVELEPMLEQRPDLAAQLQSLYETYRVGRGAIPDQANEPPISEAERLYRSLGDHSPRSSDAVERLCAARPDLEHELRALHAECLRASAEVESARLAVPREDDQTTLVASDLIEPFRAPHAREREYFLIETIARGGFGIVEKVWDARLRRVVARKVLPVDARPERLPVAVVRRLSRFLAEAQIQSQLSHPAILPVVDVGLDARGRPYYTMPLVHGEHLGKVIERMHKGEAGASLARCVQILVQACEAMAYAHEKGVIHRDLKPQNIMVGRFGETFLMDWGLARVLKAPSTRDQRPSPSVELSTLRADLDPQAGGMLTLEGDVLGTPAFMAPEQAAGHVSETGHLADQYSMGAILYQVLTARAPYSEPASSDPVALVNAVRRSRPEAIAKLAPKAPVELVAVCERAMARVPAERYATMRAFAEDLRAYLEGRVVRAHATGALAELRKWVRRNRTAAGVSACALAIILLALMSGYWLQARGRRQAEASNAALKDEQARSEQRLRKARWAGYRSDLKEVQARLDASDVTPGVDRLLAGCDPELRGWEWDWLDHRLDESDRVFVTDQEITSVAASPDGNLIAGGNHFVRVWQGDTGNCVLAGSQLNRIHCMTFSPDGGSIATGSQDATLRLWDLASGRQAAKVPLPDTAWAVAFLDDGRIASACEDRRVRLHEADSLAITHELPAFTAMPYSVTANDLWLAAGDESGEIRVWDLVSLEVVADCRVGGGVNALQFDAGTNELWGLAKGGVFRLDPRNPKVYPVDVPFGDEQNRAQRSYCALAVAADLVGIGLADGIHVVRLDGTPRARLFGAISDLVKFEFSADGKRAVSGHHDGKVRLWSLDRLGATHELAGPGEVLSICFSSDSSQLFASGLNGRVAVFDLTQIPVARREIDTGQGPIMILASPDGSSFLTVRRQRGPEYLKQWDARTLKLLAEATMTDFSTDAAWSADGKFLALSRAVRAVLVRGLDGEGGITDLGRSHNLTITRVAISPHSDEVATLDDTGGLCVWRTDGKKRGEWRAHEADGKCLEWSNNGQLLATAGSDVPWGKPTVKLFDAASGELKGRFDVQRILRNLSPRGTWSQIAFTPDSNRLAYTDNGRVIRLIDTASCEPVLSIEVKHNVSCLAFSPDGRFLAAGDEDGGIHLYWAGPRDREARAK